MEHVAKIKRLANVLRDLNQWSGQDQLSGVYKLATELLNEIGVDRFIDDVSEASGFKISAKEHETRFDVGINLGRRGWKDLIFTFQTIKTKKKINIV